MSALEVTSLGQPWAARQVVTFHGQHDTHIDTGEDYPTLTLGSIFTMEPGSDSKRDGHAFIPSTYHEYDARSHKSQRDLGQFVTLAADIDKGNHPLKQVQSIVSGICRDAAWLIYASAHACPGDMRWRVIIPVAEPMDFDEWNDAQNALFNSLERFGLECDRALQRAGQPVYLPNVPATHAKTGEPLRDEDGKPRFYERASSGTSAHAIDLTRGPISTDIALIKQHREAEERDRQRLRAEAERRRAERPQGDPGANVIDEFNASNPIATLLTLYGYTQCPRNGDDWRSPMQTGESYATRIMGDSWVSLSDSDAGAGLGAKHAAGCYGDAYDLLLHFEHGGDHKAAFRKLYAERRASQGLGLQSPPPAPQEGDPGWTDPPEGPCEIEDMVIEPDVGALSINHPESATDELGFDLTAWTMDRYEGEAPPIEWLCENTIPQGVPALFAAMGGIGKSFIALDLALEIAAGVIRPSSRKVLGGTVLASGSVVVLSAEDSKDSIHRRIASIDPGGRREAGCGRAFVIPLPEVGGPMPLIVGDRGEFKRTTKFDALVRQLQRIDDLKLVIIDPLQAFVTADITKDPAAGQFMWSAFAQICAETGATVIACHHMRKEGMTKIDSADGAREAIRGSTALIDGARATYALWPAGEETAQRICQELGVEHQPKRIISGAVVKSNDEHDWEVHTYVRAASGLLEEATAQARSVQAAGGRLTQDQIERAFKEIDDRWQAGNPFSAAANAVERYLPNYLQRQFNVPKKIAKDHFQEWMIGGFLMTDMRSSNTKQMGLKVLKWPHS